MATPSDSTLEETKTSSEPKSSAGETSGNTGKVPDISGSSKAAGPSEGYAARPAPESAGKYERPRPSFQGKHEGHVLIGEGVKIVGDICDCQQIEIYGTVEGDLEVEELIVHENGLHKGNVKTDRAQVYGSIDGEVVVKHLLDVKAKGSVAGKTQYGDIAIEVGGRVVGTLEDGSAKKSASADTASLKSRTDRILSETKTAEV